MKTKKHKSSQRKTRSTPPSCSDVWEYSHYRATLKCNNEFFAFVTLNAHDALTKDQAAVLINALNRSNAGTERQEERRAANA